MQEQTLFSKCLNKELQYYGLKFTGLLFGGFIGLLGTIKFNLTFGIMASTIGYLLGASVSLYWHKGSVQKWCYWNLPTQLIAGSKYLPKSCKRKFL